MNFSDQFYGVLRQQSQQRGWQSSFAQKAGISQSSLSKIISGETKAPELKTIAAIIDALEAENLWPVSTIRRMRENSPIEIAHGNASVPVFALAGAAPAKWPEELSPLFNVSIPSDYMKPSDFAVMVDGHSMEPLIPHGAIVGIWKDAPFKSNEIYLAHLPYEGLVIKRVGIDFKNNEFIFKSQNPDKDAYPDFRISIAESEKIIIGRIVWVLVGY